MAYLHRERASLSRSFEDVRSVERFKGSQAPKIKRAPSKARWNLPPPKLVWKRVAIFADHCANCHATRWLSCKTEIAKISKPASAGLLPDRTRTSNRWRALTGEEKVIIDNRHPNYRYSSRGASGPNDHETLAILVLFIRHLPHLTEEDLQLI